MATTFTVLIKPSGGDYTSLSTAVTNCACDLTSSATLVFSQSGITGTMSDNTGVTGLTSGATGTCIHCSPTQILIASISGTFQSGEIVYETLSVNFVTITNAGSSCQLTFEIDGVWNTADPNPPNVTGYTTNSTNYIFIYTTQLARHNGTYDTSAYRIESSTGNEAGGVFSVESVGNVNINGIQGYNTSGLNQAGESGVVIGGNVSAINFQDCIFRSPRHTYNMGHTAGTVTITNCIALPTSSSVGQDALNVSGSGGTTDCYNCVFIGGVNGVVVTAGTVLCENCYAYEGSGTAYSGPSIITCAANDSTGNLGLTNIAYSTSSGTYFTNVTSGSENFNINLGSALIASGTNLYSQFSTDIVGDTRQPTGNWDVGAFVYIAAHFTPSPLPTFLPGIA